MGVVTGAVGKSPAIEKCNRLLQTNSKGDAGKCMESRIIGSEEERSKKYPDISMDFSWLGRTEDEK